MDSFSEISFSCRGGRFTVILSSEALGSMLSECNEARNKETGGILIGYYSETGAVAIVTESTSKPEDSTYSRTSFRRGIRGLKRLLATRWGQGRYYLGEWHFHPGGSPVPSGSDIQAMKAIAENNRYQCKEPILIIAGGDPFMGYEFSATVFPKFQNVIRLEKSL